jgi:hypothetical protein
MNKIWTWVKTAAKFSTGGMSALYLYGGLLLAGAMAAMGAMAWHAGQVDGVRQAGHEEGAATVQGQWDKAKLAKAYADNAALRESQREVSRLVQVNQEVQRAYNDVLGQLAAADADRADGAGLRNAERAAIVDAASRAAAGACARYAALSERHIDGVERDADQMGRLAVRATAGVEALQRTLRERRAALDARREALSKTTPKE